MFCGKLPLCNVLTLSVRVQRISLQSMSVNYSRYNARQLLSVTLTLIEFINRKESAYEVRPTLLSKLVHCISSSFSFSPSPTPPALLSQITQSSQLEISVQKLLHERENIPVGCGCLIERGQRAIMLGISSIKTSEMEKLQVHPFRVIVRELHSADKFMSAHNSAIYRHCGWHGPNDAISCIISNGKRDEKCFVARLQIQPSTLWKCLNCYIIRRANVCAE